MIPDIRVESSVAIQKLAKELKLPYDQSMQDWAYEVADPKSVTEYINHYVLLNDDDEKFVLMQMVIQAINDQESIAQLKSYWNIIKELLIKDFKTHEYTIYYWSRFTKGYVKDEWKISPYIDTLWTETKKI